MKKNKNYEFTFKINKDDFKAMSWTLDYDKAEWFANRFGIDGYILEATINKNIRFVIGVDN